MNEANAQPRARGTVLDAAPEGLFRIVVALHGSAEKVREFPCRMESGKRRRRIIDALAEIGIAGHALVRGVRIAEAVRMSAAAGGGILETEASIRDEGGSGSVYVVMDRPAGHGWHPPSVENSGRETEQRTGEAA